MIFGSSLSRLFLQVLFLKECYFIKDLINSIWQTLAHSSLSLVIFLPSHITFTREINKKSSIQLLIMSFRVLCHSNFFINITFIPQLSAKICQFLMKGCEIGIVNQKKSKQIFFYINKPWKCFFLQCRNYFTCEFSRWWMKWIGKSFSFYEEKYCKKKVLIISC